MHVIQHVEVELAFGPQLYRGAPSLPDVDAFMLLAGLVFTPYCASALPFGLGDVPLDVYMSLTSATALGELHSQTGGGAGGEFNAIFSRASATDEEERMSYRGAAWPRAGERGCPVPSRDQCRRRCESLAHCQSWSYDREHSLCALSARPVPRCWLPTHDSGLVNHPAATGQLVSSEKLPWEGDSIGSVSVVSGLWNLRFDFDAAALEFGRRHGLSLGEGCSSDACVADRLTAAAVSTAEQVADPVKREVGFRRPVDCLARPDEVPSKIFFLFSRLGGRGS
jgi:hypothetical protein